MEMEETADGTVTLSCSARGFPAPTVVWTTSDGQVLKTASHRETDGGVHSSVQFTVASDLKAFCNVSNEYGADAVTFDIRTSEFLVSVPARVRRVGLHLSPPTPQAPGLVQRLFVSLLLSCCRVWPEVFNVPPSPAVLTSRVLLCLLTVSSQTHHHTSHHHHHHSHHHPHHHR